MNKILKDWIIPIFAWNLFILACICAGKILTYYYEQGLWYVDVIGVNLPIIYALFRANRAKEASDEKK